MTDKDNTNKDPNIAIFFSNVVFSLGIIFSVLIILYAGYKIYNPFFLASQFNKGANVFYFSCIFLGIISSIFFIMCFMLSKKLKINLSISFFTISLSIFIFESFLGISQYSSNQNLTIAERIPINLQKAKKLGISYDPRTKSEFLKDLNQEGVEAFPNYVPQLLISSNGLNNRNNNNIFPLGGIANIVTTYENESGYYPIIKTDKYGFNNKKDLFKKNDIELMLVGDSFIEGYSVNQNQSIQAVLNDLNFKTVSIGKGGSGPLLEFAKLREYGKPFEPQKVVWFYYRNDLRNLKSELNSPLLKRYLNDKNFSQDLINKQEEMDLVLKEFMKTKMNKNKKMKGLIKRNWTEINTFINILKLTNLRSLIKLRPSQPEINYENEIIIFKKIMLEAQNLVNEWNGKLYFVYLPSYESYLIGRRNEFRKKILLSISGLGIPIIDIYSDVFQQQEDPTSLFPTTFCPPCHYNSLGYKLIAEAIRNKISKP